MPLVRKNTRDQRGHFHRIPYTAKMIAGLQSEDPILFGIAKGPWALEWAERQEARDVGFSGQDIYELAPNPPSDAIVWAEDIASQLRRENNADLESLYAVAVAAGFTKERETFGMYLGCQATGCGISWDDDLRGCHDLIQVPYREFHV